ncbi:MAG: PDZ domain-containing protein [Planctomycetota bacterium]
MKTKVIALIALAGLFSTDTAISAESESTGPRPFMGLLLDPAPLPELLTKHLGLSPGQGIRIRNVQRRGSADEAGLERDDIIIGFEDDEVDDNERFVDAVREAGVGAEVSLQIIHLGKRKTVEIKLIPAQTR